MNDALPGMRRRHLTLLIVPFLAGGCVYPTGGGCGNATRDTELRAAILGAAGDTLALAYVSLIEIRGAAPPAELSVGVYGRTSPNGRFGGPLQDRIAVARLESPAGATLFDIPLAIARTSGIFEPVRVPLADRDSIAALRASFRTGRTVLHLEARTPAPSPVRVELPVQQAEREFRRPNCS
jgi:hypothetical protein